MSEILQIDCEDSEPSHFTMLPNFILDLPNLTHSALRLYIHYRRICGNDSKRSCWMSLKTLAEQCYMNRQTIIVARKLLEELNLISVKRKRMSNGAEGLVITVINVWTRNNEECTRAKQQLAKQNPSTKQVLAEQNPSTKQVLGEYKTGTRPSTKQVLGPVQNRYSINIKDNNIKEEKDEEKKINCGSRSQDGFFHADDEENGKEPTYGEIATNKLCTSLMEKRKIMHIPTNLRSWPFVIDKFIKDAIITVEEFDEVLDWYIIHVGEEFIPIAYSAQTFCERFVNINDAMDRCAKESERNGKTKRELRYEQMKKELIEEGVL